MAVNSVNHHLESKYVQHPSASRPAPQILIKCLQLISYKTRFHTWVVFVCCFTRMVQTSHQGAINMNFSNCVTN